MIEHIDIIDALADQMTAMLDLMQCSNDDVDKNSIRLAAEMSLNMLDDIMMEVHEIKMDWECRNEKTN